MNKLSCILLAILIAVAGFECKKAGIKTQQPKEAGAIDSLKKETKKDSVKKDTSGQAGEDSEDEY